TIDIIKINPENKKIKTIKSINLSNYFSEKYQNIETIGVSYASKYEDKMYILVNVLNANIDDNSNSKFHLLEYNLEGNKESIMELKTDSKMALAKAKLEDNKLYMVMSNDYDNSSITELNLLTYNILDKSLDEDKYVLDNREKRGIRSIEIDSNKIVAYTSRLNSILSWDNKFMLYI
ncbi:hypothetical protein SIK48_19230, partial [Clostridioides difficile]|nr:hypothetical protein [Clostridioides difficile]